MDAKRRPTSNAVRGRIIPGNNLLKHCRDLGEPYVRPREVKKETPPDGDSRFPRKGWDRKPCSDEEEVTQEWWWTRYPDFDGGYNYELGLDTRPKKP